jgi:hypothetical protein
VPLPVQLRVGNVIEHNGKLLQVVSLQNRAMGVGRGMPHAPPACFTGTPLQSHCLSVATDTPAACLAHAPETL